MPTNLVGRKTELASLSAFLAGISERASALVLQGEAGMGKTTLWRVGVLEAEERGLCLLQVSAVESESVLSFCGISDLLDPVLDEALAPLPPAQKRALSRALVLDDDEGAPADPHAVGVAFLNALRALAAEWPLVVAVDDVQWLDAASAGALGYAARRLRSERVGVLLSHRSSVDSSLLHELRRALSGGRFEELEIGPLEAGELHHVVRDHLGVALSRPLLREVHQASGGNPFYALEIVRMLGRTGFSVKAGQPLPVPEPLHDLVHGRLLALPRESRDFLLAAVAHAQPTTSVTEAASGVGRTVGLAPALELHIVELDGDRIRFTHPLLAAGVYQGADPLRRAAVHARLAELLEDPESRAWQLAASVDEPDETVAAVLEEAASYARARGAPRSAAVLLERASALTPAESEVVGRRRVVAAGSAHHEAGDTDRARVLLEAALARSPPGGERAEVLVALARVRSDGGDLRAALALDTQAIGEADPGSLVEAWAQVGLSGTRLRMRERLAEAVELLGKAASTARTQGAAQLEAECLQTKLLCEALLARSEAVQTSEAAWAFQRTSANYPVLRQPRFSVTFVRFWHDDLVGARQANEEMAADATEQGDESSLPYVLFLLTQIECALGAFEHALERAATGQLIAEQTGQPHAARVRAGRACGR
jgi:tetratricopeptide (TPR) repeat protein